MRCDGNEAGLGLGLDTTVSIKFIFDCLGTDEVIDLHK